MLYVMVMLAAVTVVWVATSALATSAVTTETRRETKYIAAAAFDGVVDRLKADAIAGNLSLPTVRAYSSGGNTITVTATDNSATLPHSMKVTSSTVINGKTYRDTRVVGQPMTAKPLYYTLFFQDDFSTVNPITTGSSGANGDIGCNGKLTLSSSGNDIEGDVETVGALNVSGTVNGTKWSGAPSITFTCASNAAYLFNSDYVPYWTVLSDRTFFPVFGHYPLYYQYGNLSIYGTFTGRATIYVVGNLTITGDVTYGDASSHVAFIVTGNVNIQPSVTHFAGYYFVQGNLTTSGSNAKNLVSGAIATKDATFTCPFQATYDPLIFNSATEAKNLYLPGFWP